MAFAKDARVKLKEDLSNKLLKGTSGKVIRVLENPGAPNDYDVNFDTQPSGQPLKPPLLRNVAEDDLE